MFFTINSINKSQMLLSARRRILIFPMKSNEIALNKYLIRTYHMSLKHICLALLNSCIFAKDLDNNTVITFRNKELDNLAGLITYGNGQLQGSQILAFAFHRDE